MRRAFLPLQIVPIACLGVFWSFFFSFLERFGLLPWMLPTKESEVAVSFKGQYEADMHFQMVWQSSQFGWKNSEKGFQKPFSVVQQPKTMPNDVKRYKYNFDTWNVAHNCDACIPEPRAKSNLDWIGTIIQMRVYLRMQTWTKSECTQNKTKYTVLYLIYSNLSQFRTWPVNIMLQLQTCRLQNILCLLQLYPQCHFQ